VPDGRQSQISLSFFFHGLLGAFRQNDVRGPVVSPFEHQRSAAASKERAGNFSVLLHRRCVDEFAAGLCGKARTTVQADVPGKQHRSS